MHVAKAGLLLALQIILVGLGVSIVVEPGDCSQFEGAQSVTIRAMHPVLRGNCVTMKLARCDTVWNFE
jgi:hypothetical protein